MFVLLFSHSVIAIVESFITVARHLGPLTAGRCPVSTARGERNKATLMKLRSCAL